MLTNNILIMSERLTVAEQRNKRKGRNYSIALHVILLLLLFFFGRFKNDPEQSIDDQYAVAIDFSLDRASNSTKGQEAAGERPEQAEEDERAQEESVPDVPLEEPEEEVEEEVEEIVDEAVQEIPDPIEPEVVEVVEEDSPIEAFEDPVIIEKPKKEPVPDKPKANQPVKKPTKATKPSKPSTPTTKKPTKSGNGSGTKNTSTKPGGSGTGKTSSGSGAGEDKTGNDGASGIGTGGTGKGEYDDSGRGIFGRRIIKTPSLGSIMNEKVTGKIVIKMCVNPRGNVIFTDLIRSETTIRDRSLLKKALAVAKNYVYEKDVEAPAEQCGKFTFKLDIDGLK